MSADRFLAQYDEARKEFLTVRDAPPSNTTTEDYQRVDAMFADMLSDPLIGDGEELVEKTEKETELLDGEFGELEMEVAQLKAQLAAAEEELAYMLSADYEEVVPDLSEELGEAQDKRAFQAYCSQLAELAAGVALAKTVFTGLLAKSVEDICEERVSIADVRYAEPAAWARKREQLEKLLSSVEAKATALRLVRPSDEASALAEVSAMAADVKSHLSAGHEARQTRDTRLKAFYGECDKLTLWCRQQLANLDAMQELDHVQQYCRTLVENYATMSGNFAVLVESVAPYVQANHVPVQRALQAVDQLWFNVLATSQERLAKTLYEVHPKSFLEDEVSKYAPYPKHLAELLKTLTLFLGQEKELSAEAQAVLRDCEQLSTVLAKVGPETAQQLKAFADRARARRGGYTCFREGILSRLTYAAAPAETVLDSKRRQMEFEECVKELKTWGTAQAHGESWRDIYSKIVEIKRVVQHEQEYVDERAGGSTA